MPTLMPASSRRTARGNRLGLTLVGLTLTAAGAAALARGHNLLPALLGAAHDPVLTDHTRRYPASHWWFWPALAALAALIALLALRWLAVQTRNPAIHHLNLENDTRHGATHMPARAATAALHQDLTDNPCIHHAHAAITGTPITPHLIITITSHTDPTTALHHTHNAITRLRHALETPHLTTTITIR